MLLRDDDGPRKLTCAVCGTDLQHKRVGRVRKFCSDACRIAAHRTIKAIGFDPFRYTNSVPPAGAVPPAGDAGCNEKAENSSTESMACKVESSSRGSPVNLLGGSNFHFADDAIRLDPELRRKIIKMELGR
jgi:hypothetical protein